MAPSTEAADLHMKGREAGTRGDYPEALSLLTKAAELAPDWPYPVYDRAYTHLLMQDFKAALADYRRTLALSARGFFKAHVAVDMLQREESGEFPAGLYFAYSTLEHAQEAERREILRQLVAKYPSFAPAWLDFSALAATPHERLERIEKGLVANPDPHTSGMLRLNQAFVVRALGDEARAESILREILDDPATDLAAAAWAKVLLTKEGSDSSESKR